MSDKPCRVKHARWKRNVATRACGVLPAFFAPGGKTSSASAIQHITAQQYQHQSLHYAHGH